LLVLLKLSVAAAIVRARFLPWASPSDAPNAVMSAFLVCVSGCVPSQIFRVCSPLRSCVPSNSCLALVGIVTHCGVMFAAR
jgi:hypothetical protein